MAQCPQCQSEMRSEKDGSRNVLACYPCGIVIDEPQVTAREVAMKLPGLDPGRQQKAVVVPEKTLVQSIRQALLNRGYMVERVGQWLANKAGNDRAIADLLIRSPRWSRGMWLQLEVKTPAGAVSPAQQAMESIGGLIIVRSVPEAIDAVLSLSPALEKAAQIQTERAEI